MRLDVGLFLVVSLLLFPGTARADKVFSLVVGVNRPLNSGTQHLRYADDDAILHHRLLASLGESVLLVQPDPATSRLHGKVPGALPPTKKNIEAGLESLLSRARKARRSGHRVQFYFVYSGHGDVKNNEGYLALADGRFTSRDLADKVLARTGANVNHVIIDACRSYFMAFVRRAGGHRRKTRLKSAPGSQDLARRFPNTGFLLSTSSGSDSHEWEGFQAGIFSHEVRSGLLGAADVNRDGRVSYGEIWAFVRVANSGIRNQRFRPDVYMRAPRSDTTRPIMDMRSSRACSLTIPAKTAGRFSLESSDGVRLLDLHADTYASVTLWIPGHLRVYVRDVRRGKEYLLEPTRRHQLLGTLFHRTSRYASKGAAHEAFSRIFSVPFTRLACSRELRAYTLGPDPPSVKETPSARGSRPKRGALRIAYDLRTGFLKDAGPMHGLRAGLTLPLGPVALGASLGYGRSQYSRSDEIAVDLEEVALDAVLEYRPWRWRRLDLVLELATGFHWGWQRGLLSQGQQQEVSRPFFQYLFRAGVKVLVVDWSSLFFLGQMGQVVVETGAGVKGPFIGGLSAGLELAL